MFNSAVLDIAIGLAFLYLLLALICTTINELIESVLKKRAKYLERGVRELFGCGDTVTEARKKAEREVRARPDFPTDPEAAKKAVAEAVKQAEDEAGKVTKLVEKLYEHPLVFSLFGGKYEEGSRGLPSYIPSRAFALALLDLANPPKPSAVPAAGLSGAARSTVDEPEQPQVVVNVQTGDAHASESPPTSLPKPEDAAPLAKLRAKVEPDKPGVVVLPDQVKKALTALIDAAGSDMNQVRENIETWFDSSMDRVSGWYKRHVQCITLLVAAGLTVALNADTVAIAKALARDPVLRANIVAAATKPAPEPAPPPHEAKAKPEPKDQKPPSDLEPVVKQINELRGYGWPLGWDCDDTRAVPETPFVLWKPFNLPVIGLWLTKLIGWALTAIAVSLGAPFWFDVLNRFVKVRSALKPAVKGESAKKDESTKKK